MGVVAISHGTACGVEDEDEDEDGDGMSMWIGGHESRQICAARESVRERR